MKKSLSLVILFILLLTACGGQAQSISGNYAGQVEAATPSLGWSRTGNN